MTDVSHLVALGTTTKYTYDKPDAALLEKFESPVKLDASEASNFLVQVTAPEFTSLCPLTGQPDFAEIYIEYTPAEHCVESKSLKLYLGSYRMFGEFHEACVKRISEDLIKLLEPIYLVVEGRFTPRGGIKFWPKYEYFRDM